MYVAERKYEETWRKETTWKTQALKGG